MAGSSALAAARRLSLLGRRIIFVVTGWRRESGCVSCSRGLSGGQVLCGGPCGQFGAGVDVQLGENVGQVHLDSAGGDEQAPGDSVVPQAFADQADDLQFGGGQAGPPGGGTFAAAALAGRVGYRIVQGESLALFPCLGEAVVAQDTPGLAGGARGCAAVSGESGGQVLQPPPGRGGGGG